MIFILQIRRFSLALNISLICSSNFRISHRPLPVRTTAGPIISPGGSLVQNRVRQTAMYLRSGSPKQKITFIRSCRTIGTISDFTTTNFNQTRNDRSRSLEQRTSREQEQVWNKEQVWKAGLPPLAAYNDLV